MFSHAAVLVLKLGCPCIAGTLDQPTSQLISYRAHEQKGTGPAGKVDTATAGSTQLSTPNRTQVEALGEAIRNSPKKKLIDEDGG